MASPSVLAIGNRRLAYHLHEGALPGVMFLGGFNSNMNGAKAIALENFCIKHGQRFIRFDYTGHGQSSCDFKNGTIGSWKRDALNVLDNLGVNKNILVGSSMGAWLALLLALERKNAISAIIAISGAPDFTERLIWEKINPAQKKQLSEEGLFYAKSCYGEDPYPITRQLIEEGRNHLLLEKDIVLDVPVRLLHGMQDEDVPWDVAVQLMHQLKTSDVRLQLIKDGNHRLSEPRDLQLLCETVKEFI